ncbi:hypothetical protein EAF00_010386 [Botryotinia globosa]|nr:hypothetical protein EAF00_010386 [Botryotinia globosa]
MAASPKDGDLTIETLYSLDNLLEFESRPNQLNINSNLLNLALWASSNNRVQAVKSIAEFRQKPAAKHKPPAAHTSPVRYVKKMNSVVEALTSGEVAVKTNVPMEHNKEIVYLTGNGIKTERTLDPSTHRVSPNDSKPNGSLVNTQVKVEETVENDLLTEKNGETIDAIENDANVVDDQGVGADNNDYNDDGSGCSADLNCSFDDSSSDGDYADDDEGGKLQKFIKNGISVIKTRTPLKCAHNQVSG